MLRSTTSAFSPWISSAAARVCGSTSSSSYASFFSVLHGAPACPMNIGVGGSHVKAVNRPKAPKSLAYGEAYNVRQKSMAAATSTFDQSVQAFPSIVIGPDRSIEPQGTFAEAQAQFLDPDPDAVETLRQGLLESNIGIVAHYYMDVELQGVLQALKQTPGLENRIGIADSLKMGDLAVEMASSGQRGGGGGVDAVICLGVDFMAESVQAIMQKNDLGHIPVYRATAKAIGCSLAESAEGNMYKAWLQQASSGNAVEKNGTLHVIYINTSLETKAVSSSLVPTITCTSSNVLQTLLHASAQVPGLSILYGPDTYMGHNLQTLLDVILASPDWTDARIQSDLHPEHSNETLQTLRNNLEVFPQGNCVVHHMFGKEVVQTVRENYYDDCYMTAHLEVPGEMFEIAMEKSLEDKGVVGSTSDILNFITRKVQERASSLDLVGPDAEKQRLRFVLGTEAGMVTSIVQSVQKILSESQHGNVEAEIIFPVSSEAVMSTDDATGSMPLVPGVAGGEGCSTAGGCATCPFMKMNDLDRVHDIIEMVKGTKSASSDSGSKLQSHLPPNRLEGKLINGLDAVDLGSEAILYMRQFMQKKALPDELVEKIRSVAR